MRYYLNFLQSIGRKEIDEPAGSKSVPFVISQENGRKGRDVIYSGGTEAKYTITKAVDRYGFYFDQFLKDWLRYSFELQIELEVDFGEGIVTIGNVAGVTTNQYDTIDFVVVQKLSEATLKNNYDVVQDISGLPKERVLLPAKPIIQESKWKLAPFNYELNSQPNEFAIQDNSVYFNPIQQQITSALQDSLPWGSNIDPDGFPFKAVRAEDNLRNVLITFNTNILYKYRPNEAVGGNLDKAGSLGLYVRYGQTYETASEIVVWYNGSNTENDMDFQLPNVMTAEIPFVNQTDSIWIYFRVGSQNGAVNRIQFSYEDTFTISAYSTGLTTVVECINYSEGVEAVVQMAGGLELVSPRLQRGGQFYDQYITNASYMRNLLDKPFNISFKDIIEGHIRPEWNGDYEITADGKVFIGLYDDFYTNIECGRFEQAAYEDFLLQHDDSKAIKVIKSGYKNYASQKETETAGTFDTVHGEAQHKTESLNAKNEREALVEFKRDAFGIANDQRKSYDLPNTAATQDDRKVIILDTVGLPFNSPYRQQTNTFFLNHVFDSNTNRLSLQNEGNFNWQTLGIGSQFEIIVGLNVGLYTVYNVQPQTLTLFSPNGATTDVGNTTVRYNIDQAIVRKARTNEGFSLIEGIADGQNFINLRFTLKRVLRNYFEREIASYCFPTKSSVMNTEYLNNPDAVTQFEGELEPIREGDTYTPTNPIVEPVIVSCTLAMTLREFWEMSTNIRTLRGFIRTWDAWGMPIMIYPQEASWITPQKPDIRQGFLELKGEKKYEPYFITIVALGETRLINDEPVTGFNFSFDDTGYVTLYDSVGKRLYSPVPYDRVKLNNSGAANSPEELALWLSEFDIEE